MGLIDPVCLQGGIRINVTGSKMRGKTRWLISQTCLGKVIMNDGNDHW